MAKGNLDIDSRTTEELFSWYRSGNLIVNRRYQRKLVWSINEKTSLISSIKKQYPIPLLLFVNIEGNREILDGMQRLEAIMSFIEQRFSLDGSFFDLDSTALTKELKDKEDIVQLEPKLSREDSASIARYRFAISEFTSSNDNIDEVFRRINANGKTLSKQELRSAGALSKFSELVRKISTVVRGDTSHSDIITLNLMHNISINNDGLNYGVEIDNHFYVKNHILTRRSIRESIDEELVAHILGYVCLTEKPTAGSGSLDTFYGEGDSSHAIGQREQIEKFIQTTGFDTIKNNYLVVNECIKDLFSNQNITFLTHILGDKNSSQECPRYFQAVFLALYEVLINRKKIIHDKTGLFNQLKNTGVKVIDVTDGGRWAASAREKSVNDLSALIDRYFKASTKGYINHAWITEINTILTNSKSEQPSYDFKQGLVELNGKSAKFNDACLEQIIQTCVAINNIKKNSLGYVLVGISDKLSTAERVKELFGSESEEVNGFYVHGIDHEAILVSKNIDDYFMLIKQKIQAMKFTDALKTKLLKDIELCTYNGSHILKLKVEGLGRLANFDNKYYIRQGSSTDVVEGADKTDALFEAFGL